MVVRPSRIKALGLFAAGSLTTYGLLETLKSAEWSGSRWPASASSFSGLFKSNSLEAEHLQPPPSLKTTSNSLGAATSTTGSVVLHKSTRPAVASELKNSSFVEAASAAASKLNQWRAANQIPGFVVGVSVKGETVWRHADGFADIENGIPCTAETVMRIASISKAITSALLGQMMAEKKVDLDLPIRSYLSAEQWPDKSWQGEPVEITLRQLASHLGGIRHYKKPDSSAKGAAGGGSHDGDFPESEFYLCRRFPSVVDSLALFKDDPLVAKPGTKYNYTTFGFTLISAVLEAALKKEAAADKESKDTDSSKKVGPTFQAELRKLFTTLGMRSTFLDQNEPLIYNRASYYMLDPRKASSRGGGGGRLINVPSVDASYKWAGGGLLSTVADLLKFGNAMLYSFKGGDRAGRPGFLPQAVVDELWTPAEATKEEKGGFFGYGLGWVVLRDEAAKKAFTAEPRFSTIISHSGGAVGASSLLLIEPDREIVLSLLVNMQAAGELYRIGYDVLEAFQKEAIALEGGGDGGGNQQKIVNPWSKVLELLGWQ